MKPHRPAYTLNEILALLVVVVILLTFCTKMGWTLIREVPMTSRRFNTQASTRSMLDALREDVEAARDLRLSEGEGEDAADTLIMDGPAGRVLYTFASGQMRRMLPEADPNAPGASCWTLPDVRIAWRVQRQNSRPAALEIRTWQQRTFMGKERVNFEQAHLFFVGIRKEWSSREE